MRLVVLLAALIHCVPAYDVDVKKLEGLARARVEVESGHRPAYVYCIYIYMTNEMLKLAECRYFLTI